MGMFLWFSIKWWNYRNISNNVEVHATWNFKDHIEYNFCNYEQNESIADSFERADAETFSDAVFGKLYIKNY